MSAITGVDCTFFYHTLGFPRGMSIHIIFISWRDSNVPDVYHVINCICESLDLSVPAQEFSDRNHEKKPSISYYSYYVNLVWILGQESRKETFYIILFILCEPRLKNFSKTRFQTCEKVQWIPESTIPSPGRNRRRWKLTVGRWLLILRINEFTIYPDISCAIDGKPTVLLPS